MINDLVVSDKSTFMRIIFYFRERDTLVLNENKYGLFFIC